MIFWIYVGRWEKEVGESATEGEPAAEGTANGEEGAEAKTEGKFSYFGRQMAKGGEGRGDQQLRE